MTTVAQFDLGDSAAAAASEVSPIPLPIYSVRIQGIDAALRVQRLI